MGADGTCRDNKTYKNPPKTAKGILERLQASGYVGDLQDSTGDSLSGDDLLGDKLRASFVELVSMESVAA